MFEISQIRCFVAVAEELHFGRAAERLNMTQPPLSRQIRLLEHHVGTPLLERTSRVVRLTAAGKTFLPEAARILRLASEAALAARRTARGERGTLAIGFTATYGYGLLPEIVRRLHARAPGVALTLKELVTSAQLEALGSGQIDVGLLRPHLPQGELDTAPLGDEALMLALPAADAAAWPGQPALQALAGRPFLMYSPYEAGYFHKLVESSLERARVKPDVVEYVAQIHTMLALVAAGMGVALVPQSAARLRFEGVELRQVAMDPARPVEMVYSWRRDNDNPLLEILRRDILGQFDAAN